MTPREITSARAALGLTQAELAAVMGYQDKSRISELERGKRAPSPAAERLIRAYLDGYRPADWPNGNAQSNVPKIDRLNHHMRDIIGCFEEWIEAPTNSEHQRFIDAVHAAWTEFTPPDHRPHNP